MAYSPENQRPKSIILHRLLQKGKKGDENPSGKGVPHERQR